MNQIEKAISNLSNPDKDTRYKACVELRLADSIPEPAIAALEAATHDPDPLVADAARRALANHSPTEEQSINPSDLAIQDTPLEPRKWNPLAIASFILSILIYVLFFFAKTSIADFPFRNYYHPPPTYRIELQFGAVQVISILAASVLGVVAILQIKRSGGRQKGIGFAIAGIAFQAILYIGFVGCELAWFITTR